MRDSPIGCDIEVVQLSNALTRHCISQGRCLGVSVKAPQARTLGRNLSCTPIILSHFVIVFSPFPLRFLAIRWLPDLTAKAIPLREGLDPLQMLTSDSKVFVSSVPNTSP